jgi:hypothetical protein
MRKFDMREGAMPILGLGRGNRTGSDGGSKPAEPTPSARPPRPAGAERPDPQARQYQLGNYTLDAVDQLTGMTADEIELVADRLIDGARETEEVLRELAHRVREYGVIANERLANFVKAANGCADLARTMQVRLEQREEQPAAETPPETEAGAPEPAAAKANDPDGLEAEIQAVAHDRAPPTQPGD